MSMIGLKFWKMAAPMLTELLNGRLKLLVLIDVLHVNMLLLSSLGAYTKRA